MKSRLFVPILLLLLLPALTFADLTITVDYHRNWGNAPTSNIRKLSENVALHFQEVLRDEHKIDGKLKIVYYSRGPIAFYRSYFGGKSDEYKVGLKITGTYWNQMAYQFGHEFCHIMQNHDSLKNNPNGWFHEAICELANVWVLRQMSETWLRRPPYPNWVDYRRHLKSYADNQLKDPDSQYAGTGAEWIAEWEERMHRDEPGVFTFERVCQLSYKFLPIFEEHPEAWNAVRQMPNSKKRIDGYMKDWYAAVDTEDKEHVAAIAKIMGIRVETPVVVATAVTIDTDVNDDGYTDIYDCLIVRSAMSIESKYDTDVNDDGVTNILDLMLVKAAAFEAIAAAAPPKPSVQKIRVTTWGALKRRK